uniref:Putative nucleoprotein n=1 Tax=Beihai bunya-like virus 1 TaxID=1922371 RepID=A0A1L3KPE2_9VIRU|nr:putative nucleoprotein [Beihai bunya-like virus 1]
MAMAANLTAFTFDDLMEEQFSSIAVPSDGYEALYYKGVDIPALLERAKRSARNLATFRQALRGAATVTYVRGCNLQKCLQKMTNPDERARFKGYLDALGVTASSTNLQPDTLTLSRIALIAPTYHPSFLHQGIKSAYNVMFSSLPKEVHCTSFSGCVPSDPNYDPYYYANLVYLTYFDTVINPDVKTKSTVQEIMGFANAARNSGLVSDDHKINFMDKLGLTIRKSESLQFCVNLIETNLHNDTKMAWRMMKGEVIRRDSFDPEMPELETSSESGEPVTEELSAALKGKGRGKKRPADDEAGPSHKKM